MSSSSFVTFEDFGKSFIPRKIRPTLRYYINKAGFLNVPYRLFGILFLVSVVLTGLLFIFLIYPMVRDFAPVKFVFLVFSSWVIINLAILVLIIACIYVYLDYIIYRRIIAIEDVLEEFLRYLSENLKGGMSFDKALWQSIRPQFGVLSDEIALIAKKVLTGQDIADALTDFSNKYDSPILKRSLQLIIEGMKGGGQIAYIIDRVEKNIRETKELKSEMAATNATYVIFLTASVIVIAPALFGLSYNLLVVLSNITAKISLSSGSSSSLGGFGSALSNLKIEPDSFKGFSVGAVAVISFFVSMILSTIQKGNVKAGLKYIPLFVLGGILMYIMFRELLLSLFSGFIDI